VLTLVARIEQLRGGASIPLAIQLTLNSWYAGISKLHKCRRDEIVNAASRYHGHSSQQQKEKGCGMLRMCLQLLSEVIYFCGKNC